MAKTIINDDAEDKWEGFKELVAPDRAGATVSVTRNLGDYNSLSIRFNWESNFEEGETFDTAAERVYAAVEAKVEAKLDEYN
jgi:hypothetical protein